MILDIDAHFDYMHGWLKVPHALVAQFKLRPTGYSYKDEHYAYLEEDLDGPLFIAAAEGVGYEVIVTGINDGESSPIRNLPRYR